MRIEHIVHGGRGYSMMTPEELVAAGVPQDVVAASLAALRRQAVKGECRRRIYAVASAEAQMNWAAAASIISAKTVAQRSDEERATLAALGDALAWVQAMRANVATLTANAEADITDDAAWPVCPEGVVAAAAQF